MKKILLSVFVAMVAISCTPSTKNETPVKDSVAVVGNVDTTKAKDSTHVTIAVDTTKKTVLVK